MPTPATTTTILADISQSLWSCTLLQQNAFNNGANSMNNGRDIVLMLENYGLAYAIDNNLDGVAGLNNYVYQLIGGNLGQSQQLYASGSGGIVPTPSGGGGGLTPYSIDITVTLAESGVGYIQRTELEGIQYLVTLFLLNQVFQLNTDFTYNSAQGKITFTNYTVQTGDHITGDSFKTSS